MANVGAEVGQKMRSAVSAKLKELGCYVDDELPDYIMVMVANKRTKSQMNQDLELFLNTNTSTFVDWLHVVLKKLEEITVTNPSVLKNISKRKSGDNFKAVKAKREKKDKEKTAKKSKKKHLPVSNIKVEPPSIKSLTDDLPLKANKASQIRKIVLMKENNGDSISAEENVIEDNFDIPSLSEVSNENELQKIEKKIKGVKSRLGLQVRSGSEDEDYINLKTDPDDLFLSDAATKEKRLKEEILRKISMLDASNSQEQLHRSHSGSHAPEQLSKNERSKIMFGNEDVGVTVKRTPILERLGAKPDMSKLDILNNDLKRKRVNLSESRREEEEILGVGKIPKMDAFSSSQKEERELKRIGIVDVPRESALKRLGLMSKVAVPHKDIQDQEEIDDLLTKDVPSVVKVKPRVLLPSSKQANKSLLLKAVAEAQRSVAQTRVVGSNKPDAIYTKKYREKVDTFQLQTRKLSSKDKNNLRNILVSASKQDRKEHDFSSDDDNLEYIPKPIKRALKSNSHPEYIPSSRGHSSDDCDNTLNVDDINSVKNIYPKQTKNQTFIITLDGISRNQDIKGAEVKKNTEKDENKNRKAPSPIIFEFQTSPTTSRDKVISDRLPSITSSPSIKTKERCKFWPTCRQGEKCDFIHPNTSCRAFPQCKFGDKCLYIHPTCKFETSCTRKDCPYNHTAKLSFSNAKTPQMCKFYPNCSNIHCSFYHPKPCKYGKNCKQLQQCPFSHTFPNKSSLTWRSTIKS